MGILSSYRKQFNMSPFLEGTFDLSYLWWSKQQLYEIKKDVNIWTGDLVSIDILGSNRSLWCDWNWSTIFILPFLVVTKGIWYAQGIKICSWQISIGTNFSFSTSHYKNMGIWLWGLLWLHQHLLLNGLHQRYYILQDLMVKTSSSFLVLFASNWNHALWAAIKYVHLFQ